MDDKSILELMDTLRREIELIRQEERHSRTRGRRFQSGTEREAHNKRELRLVAIRMELQIIRQQAKRQ